tara:strand:- start:8340 stop:8810 length:471 start_codon:yes stop_codon:yes gene_type:complete
MQQLEERAMVEIMLEIHEGSLEGYVVDAAQPNIRNYLEQHCSEAGMVATVLAELGERVALLRNLYVPEEWRGQGIGTELVSEFMRQGEVKGATAYLLISDEREGQANGLDLTSWYTGFGFETAIPTPAGPLMVISDAVLEEIARRQHPASDTHQAA